MKKKADCTPEEWEEILRKDRERRAKTRKHASDLTSEELEKRRKYDREWKQRDRTVHPERYKISSEKMREYNKTYREKHKQETKDRYKKYYDANRDKILERAKIYRKEHKQEIAKKNKKRREENIDTYRERDRLNAAKKRKERPEDVRQIQKKWYESHKDYVKQYKKENKEHINEWRKQYREKNKEKINERQRLYWKNNREKCRSRSREYREINKLKYKERAKEWRDKNKEKLRRWRQENRIPFSEFEGKLTIDEDPIMDANGFIMVRDFHTKEYFYPTRQALYNRIQCLRGNAGGENHLYSCEESKQSCQIYHYNPLWAEKKKRTRNTSDKYWREEVVSRANGHCQRCGRASDILHAHHIIPKGVCGMFEGDFDNGIALCPECHLGEGGVHDTDGCRLHELAAEKREAS